MTDLSAGEHIVDGLEIQRRQEEALERVRERVMAAIKREPPRRFFTGSIDWPVHLTEGVDPGGWATAAEMDSLRSRAPRGICDDDPPYCGPIDPSRWTLNHRPLSEYPSETVASVHARFVKAFGEPIMSITRHPSSQRFHDLLPVVGQMAYRLDAEMAPHGASAWGIDAWIVAMRNLELRLRKLQAAARGDTVVGQPKMQMLEVAALAMVAKRYYTDDDSPIWAHNYTDTMGALHDKKQGDYGVADDPFHNVRASVEWEVAGWVGAMIRLCDKVRRLQSFARKGMLANESALDSLEDISVYGTIAAVLWEDECPS